jgi:uncharacterized protein YdhG (YjbR/CyaY superfamily)
MAIKFTDIDEYHAAFPEVSEKLDALRRMIGEAAPTATETISYNMPAFRQHGVLVYYAAYQNHIGFYPTSRPIEVFRDALSEYKTSKGAIQFPLTKPIPEALVKKIVAFRVSEDAAKHEIKKKR